MAKYATDEKLIHCEMCEISFRPEEGFINQYADNYLRCPRCRIVMIFFQRGEGWDHAPVLIHPDVEERHREQVKREITADRLLEF